MSPAYRRHCLIAVPLLFSVAGCVHYRPQPLAPADIAEAIDRRTMPPLPGGIANESSLLAVALIHAPSLRDAAGAYRNAVAAARASRVRPLGTLTLSAEYSHQDNPRKPWLGGTVLDLPLDIGGRRSTRIDAADLAIMQARYDYLEALWQTRSAIHRALVDWRAADAETALDEEAVAIRREREARLVRRVAAGEDPQSIALAARTDRIASERRVADVQARRKQTIGSLARAIGMPPTAVGTMIIAPEADLPPPAPAAIAEWRRDAALARPDVLRAIVDYDLAEGTVKTEIAKQYPEIHIGPGYIYERGLTKLPFNIGLVLPPSDFNRAAIREAEARRAAAGTRIEGIQAGILADVDKASTALQGAFDEVRRAEQQDLPIAERSLDQAQRGFRAGETDRTDELAARGALVDTRIAIAEARRQARIARADLDDAARPPLDPAESALFTQAMHALETSQ
ncbi:CRISPR system Cascade subunit CasA [Sphingomonas sp. YR710]|uniref:TolC family protein n=1 Tax=Sphingomonas sp. YR710 TaxID=1882773 RepID=UPI0008829658|nr:TolC family protein [Sphingomonas sp. YR710]SDD60347.1 CRISPR system Cascade subunit CasA [Sphingomonas sp. YR710]